MKRLHVNLRVDSIDKSVGFYSALFSANPTVQKPDYAKWMLEDPRVNFSISLTNNEPGIEHLGIQAETEPELSDLYKAIDLAEGTVRPEGDTVCCYAQSNKSWIKDPQGVEWEIFHTYGESEVNKIVDSACCDDNCCSV
ncbi:ArsI/CadI family heavy metal resistance metalloenzyme [Roseivirga sp. E12]|uniref:ArsI/CadI family heavy metal resistance metalloenzyme n=1 Tax=Roseivirga sp. E12 TaxID=2819237 RepID=UPI001ABCF901|nr:ArsI/CadI family heavy metal resistance metalloenzyme [Roseivirga sp. E12]MBO3697423.1 glyoxalase/bleomycin resistance/dioxygenase family protein [Roseivirga sp. E12]